MSQNFMDRDNALSQASAAALAEARNACLKFAPFTSVHEGYAVILEEMDELWDECKKRDVDKGRLRVEARHCAAMALRFAAELCMEQ